MVHTILKAGADPNAPMQYLKNERFEVPGQDEWADPRGEGYIPPIKLALVKQQAIHIALHNNEPRIVFLLRLYGAKATEPYWHACFSEQAS
jgi:hypothetical protein